MLRDSYWYNLESDVKTLCLYFSLLKLKCSPSIYLKHKKDQNKYASLKNNHRNHKQDYCQKIFKSIDRSLHPTGHMPWIIFHLCRFLCVRVWDTGCIKQNPRLCSSRARWPLVPSFYSWVTRKSLFFLYKSCWAPLGFTGLEHWAPFNFS